MKIVALAGGVGGAKLAEGLYKIVPNGDLSIIVNTGDDFTLHGLYISPDLDTVCYTLAGINAEQGGWGRNDESWNCLNEINILDEKQWFQLGDKDLATDIIRTEMLANGCQLSEVVRHFCKRWRIGCDVYPMTNDPCPTLIKTKNGQTLSFQEYFVRYQCQPQVKEIYFLDSNKAKPTPGVVEKITEADFVIICPSNPWVSIDPILAINPIQDLLMKKATLAISPIIQGNTLKGPAAKIFKEKGITPSAATVADHYKKFLKGIVIDTQDRQELEEINRKGIIPFATNIIMNDKNDRERLAREVLGYCERIT